MNTIEMTILLIWLAFCAMVVWKVMNDQKLSDRIDKLYKEVVSIGSGLYTCRRQLGNIQREGKVRMEEQDIREGLTAWREVDGVLFRETIEPSRILLKRMSPYKWTYAVGGPCGYMWLDVENSTWWIDAKDKKGNRQTKSSKR